MEKHLKQLFEQMVVIRVAQETISAIYPEAKIRCPVHLCTGQEAAPVGVCSQLNGDDWIFCSHRNHGWYLAKGGDLKLLFAELYGKEAGCCRGKGGSMHLLATEVGMSLSSSIVGGTLPHAVGAAMTFKMRHAGSIACACLGDGAVEEGVFFECLNFARLFDLPVLFCIENNGYSVESRVENRRAFNLATICKGFDIVYAKSDGTNLKNVVRTAEQAICHVRRNQPAVIEIEVQRFRSHVHPPEWSTHLSKQDRRKSDPILKCPDKKWLDECFQNAEEQVKAALDFAETQNFPAPEELLADVLEKR